MIQQILSAAVLVSAITCAAASGADLEEGFTSMFNGKDLTGWEGKPSGWTVEDGAITGRSTKEKPCKAAHYLMWRGGKPADFILRLSYRLVGGNSGIQIRSRELPNFDTNGYQADMEAGEKWSGALFEHTRVELALRGTKVLIDPDGKKHVTEFADPAELQKKIKPDDWNDYEIVARGSKITLKINGVVMSEVDDKDEKHAARSGVIAVQMHPGPPMTVQFKNLRIKVFD